MAARWRLATAAGSRAVSAVVAVQPSPAPGAPSSTVVARVTAVAASAAAATALLLAGDQAAVPLRGESAVRNRDGAGGSLVGLPGLTVVGAEVDARLQVRVGSRGRGLFLTRGAPKGAVVLSVPASVVLSPERAGQLLLGGQRAGPGTLAAKEDGHEGALRWGLLPALLAHVRAELDAGAVGSFGLGPYVRVLPESFPSLPIALSPEDAARELRGTVLLPAAEQLRAQLLADRDVARRALQGSADACPEAMWSDGLWLWACGVLLTRGGLGLSLVGSEYGLSTPMLALVPLIDLANCDSELPSCEVSRGPKGEIQLVTLRALTSGAEATFDYGARSSEQTLFTFGFFPEAGEAIVTSPLSLVAEGGGLRSALLQLLALEQPGAQQAVGSAPAARLRRLATASPQPGLVDASELIAAANLLEMGEAELKAVAREASRSGAVPEQLKREPSPAARRRLVSLLGAWAAELEPQAGGGAGPPFAPLQSYRLECAALVREALQSLLGGPAE